MRTALGISRAGQNLLAVITSHADPTYIVAADNDRLAIINPDSHEGLTRSYTLARRVVYELAETGYITIGDPHPIDYRHRVPGDGQLGRPLTLTVTGHELLNDGDGR
jgi:hypothetical protein